MAKAQNVIDRCIEHFGGEAGGMAEFARVMEVDRQLVFSWKKRGYIPPKYAYEVESRTRRLVTAREVIDDANRSMAKPMRVTTKVA